MRRAERKLLARIANQLEEWADESLQGGWSTHQVKPHMKLAIEIRNALVSDKFDDVLKDITITEENS